MMKKLFVASIVLLSAMMGAGTLLAADGGIYVSENMSGGGGPSKSLITFFDAKGVKTGTIMVDGPGARVSPDGKAVVYQDHDREVALADMSGKKTKTFKTYFTESQKKLVDVSQLVWSPDGKKVAVLKHSGAMIFTEEIKGNPVPLGIIDVNEDELKTVHEVYAKGDEDHYYYTIQWFPDNRRILFAGAAGAQIVDTVSLSVTDVAKDSMVAHLTGDGKYVFHIAGSKRGQLSTQLKGPPPFVVWRYDVRKGKSEKVLSLDMPPIFSKMSHDGRYLVFQGPHKKKAALIVVDLTKKTTTEVDTEGLRLMPRGFSPRDNGKLLCVGGREGLDYGVFDLKTAAFKVLKPTDTSSDAGHRGWAILLGLDTAGWI